MHLISKRMGVMSLSLLIGIAASNALAVVIAPDGTLYDTRTTDGTTRKSRDNGATWVLIEGAPEPIAVSVAGDVYAVGYWKGKPGYFRSSDQGASWTQCSTGGPREQAIGFRAIGGALWISRSDGKSTLKSTDRCASWKAPARIDAHAIAEGPGGVMYAGANYTVWISTNGGAAWKRTTSTLEGAVGELAVDSEGTVYASGLSMGIFSSTDRGVTFKEGKGLPADGSIVSFQPTAKGMYAAYGPGVYRSVDKGANWSRVSRGLEACPGFAGHALAMARDGTLFIGCAAGVFKSTDDANSWKLALRDEQWHALMEKEKARR